MKADAAPGASSTTPRAGGRGEKRKAEPETAAAAVTEMPQNKKASRNSIATAATAVESPTAAEQVMSRSGRLIKPKKFGDDDAAAAVSSPVRNVDTDNEVNRQYRYQVPTPFFSVSFDLLSLLGTVEIPFSQRISCLDSSLGRVAACDASDK